MKTPYYVSAKNLSCRPSALKLILNQFHPKSFQRLVWRWTFKCWSFFMILMEKQTLFNVTCCSEVKPPASLLVGVALCFITSGPWRMEACAGSRLTPRPRQRKPPPGLSLTEPTTLSQRVGALWAHWVSLLCDWTGLFWPLTHSAHVFQWCPCLRGSSMENKWVWVACDILHKKKRLKVF